jgi:hypothetical protein
MVVLVFFFGGVDRRWGGRPWMVHEGSRGFDVIFFFSRVLSEVCLRQLYPYPIRSVYICTSVCTFPYLEIQIRIIKKHSAQPQTIKSEHLGLLPRPRLKKAFDPECLRAKSHLNSLRQVCTCSCFILLLLLFTTKYRRTF